MDLQTGAFVIIVMLLGLAMYMVGKYGVAELNSEQRNNQ